VHDDVVFIKNNPYISELNLKEFFLQTTVHDANFPLVNTYYRPFLEFFNRVLYQIFHLNPHGYHFANILIHILNSYLVFLLMNILINKGKAFSAALAILFLLHPLQTESVACISGISNLLYALFCLISFYAYLISQREENKGRGRRYFILSLIMYIIALFAKEQSIVLLLLIVGYEIIFMDMKNKKLLKKFISVSSFIGATGGYFLLRVSLFGHALSGTTIFNSEFILRLITIPRIILTHLSLFFWPQHLHYYRNTDMLDPALWPFMLICSLSGIIFVIIALADSSSRRIYLFSLFWFVATLLPTLNIVPIVNEYSYLLTAEHFMYVPIIGLLLFCFTLLENCLTLKKFKNTVSIRYGMFLVISCLCLILTIKQNTYWKSEVVLFERTMKYETGFGRGHILLAEAYYYDGQFEKSIRENQKALVIMSAYLKKIQNLKVTRFYKRFILRIHIALAHSYEALGQYQYSPSHYISAIEMNPRDHILLRNLGMNYIKLGDLDHAIKYFQRAIEVNSLDLMSHNSLALCYIEKKKYVQAERSLRFIVEQDPQSQSAKENLNRLLQLLK